MFKSLVRTAMLIILIALAGACNPALLPTPDLTGTPGMSPITPAVTSMLVPVSTTPSDLGLLIAKILKSYKNKSRLVLSSEMTRLMLTPQANIGVNWDCAFAFNTIDIKKYGWTTAGHPGWNEGFHSIMLFCVQTGQGLVWMTNGENGRHLYFEASHGLAEVVRWSWW